MGCLCTREKVTINGKKYTVLHRLGEGWVWSSLSHWSVWLTDEFLTKNVFRLLIIVTTIPCILWLIILSFSHYSGFSVIDLVENASTKRKYALKRIVCHNKDDELAAMREIEICRQLRHKNVIEVIDFQLEGMADMVLNTTSRVDMLLPYFRRGTIHDELIVRSKTRTFMSESQVLQIFLGVCEGVKAFHEAKPEPLAHRDLKIANICMTDSMEPVIIDVGSASEARVQVCGQSDAQKLQDLAEERCTMSYRPPELFCVQSYCTIDERTDIWSLGCVLYALCFFKSPFDAAYERGDSVALAVISGNVVFPPESPYSKDMEELIMYQLRLNPMERPYIYSVIEKANDLLIKLESRV